MGLEELPPNKSSFTKVVLLFAATILVVFVIALALVGFDGKRLLHFPYRHAGHATSQVWLSSRPAIG